MRWAMRSPEAVAPKALNMQARALQPLVQRLGGFARRRLQGAQRAPAPAIAMLSSPIWGEAFLALAYGGRRRSR